jgi:phosphoadenosine phosphosulfate reductase
MTSEAQTLRIWTRHGFVADRFTAENGAVFMSAEEATGRLGSNQKSVLVLEPGDEVAAAAGRIHEFDAVFIRFAVFSDGRGFSTARLLREKHGFKGEIRATGHFILDQIPLMARVGFSEFAVTHAPTIARLEKGQTAEIREYLQPAFSSDVPAGGRSWARRPA